MGAAAAVGMVIPISVLLAEGGSDISTCSVHAGAGDQFSHLSSKRSFQLSVMTPTVQMGKEKFSNVAWLISRYRVCKWQDGNGPGAAGLRLCVPVRTSCPPREQQRRGPNQTPKNPALGNNNFIPGEPYGSVQD